MRSGTFQVNHNDLKNIPECSTFEAVLFKLKFKYLSQPPSSKFGGRVMRCCYPESLCRCSCINFATILMKLEADYRLYMPIPHMAQTYFDLVSPSPLFCFLLRNIQINLNRLFAFVVVSHFLEIDPPPNLC